MTDLNKTELINARLAAIGDLGEISLMLPSNLYGFENEAIMLWDWDWPKTKFDGRQLNLTTAEAKQLWAGLKEADEWLLDEGRKELIYRLESRLGIDFE